MQAVGGGRRSVKVLAIGAGLLLLGMASLWMLLSKAAPAPVEEESAVQEAATEQPAHESALEEGGDALAPAEDESVSVTVASVAREGIPPPPSAVAAADVARPSAVLHGILRDAATQEPLPEFLLAFEDSAGRRLEATTDEQGRFATTEPLAAGALRVTPVDDPRRRAKPAPIEREIALVEGAFAELDLEVPCGPTYRLSIAPAVGPDLALLEARLRLRTEDNPWTAFTPVRAGTPPWVRFAPVPAEISRAELVGVRSTDGTWSGASSPATVVRGIAPGILGVTLDARAVLCGRVIDLEGAPVRDALVNLEATTPSGQGIRNRASTDKDGRYRFEFLMAGTGTLGVRSLRHAAQEIPVTLVPKETATRDFSLVALPPAGAIRGAIRSETGGYVPRVTVSLSSADPERSFNTISIEPSWETVEGRKVGKFEFPALPSGRYSIGVNRDDWLQWDPSRLTASPPFDDANFLVHDDRTIADFVLRVRDTDNGSALERFFASMDLGNGRNIDRMRNGGETVLARFPLDRGFRWRVDHEGYRPETGDERDFSIQEIRDGKIVRIADVGLRPGWGDTFRVVRRGNNKPIEGAKILLDGREAGSTRADGTVAIHAPRKPEKVEVAWQDWRVVGGIDVRPAWRRDNKKQIVVQMAPPQTPKKK
jgi:hypothetical protein